MREPAWGVTPSDLRSWLGARREVQASAVLPRIGWIEVGLLSVRVAGVLGIGRGKIVDCRGCLGVGFAK
jgi:hypothetical protein